MTTPAAGGGPGEKPTGLVHRDGAAHGTIAFTIAANATAHGDDPMLKEGTFRGFTVHCDESAGAGQEARFPPPMGYAALAIGF